MDVSRVPRAPVPTGVAFVAGLLVEAGAGPADLRAEVENPNGT